MNKMLLFVVIVIFIFLITYKPGSGQQLEKYIIGEKKPSLVTRGPVCDQSRYHDLQFGDVPPGKCEGLPKEFLGAVIEA